MGTIHITEGPLGARIEPELGAGLSELSFDKGHPHHILRHRPGSSSFTDLSMYLLAPWTNRIANASFDFAGRRYTLRPDWEDGTAIHGDVKTRNWRILDRTPLSARLTFDSRDVKDSNWPWPYAAEVRYEINGDAFITDLNVRNLGDTPMPAGVGFHPFFSRQLRGMRGNDDVEVKLVTTGRYPVTDMIPTGPAHPDEASKRLSEGGPLGDLMLDDIFAGFDGKAVIAWPQIRIEASIECSPNLGHVVVFSPKSKSGKMEEWFCVEPVTTVTDAFNLSSRGQAGTGVAIARPGEWLRTTMSIRIRAPEKHG
jgi:aldose 1-epimerase